MIPNYIAEFLPKHWADQLLEHCLNLPWLSVTEARQEYFMAVPTVKYTYGAGTGARTYKSESFDAEVGKVLYTLNTSTVIDCLGTMPAYDLNFMNRYNEQKHQLGWHADDSPEIDQNHPIAVISLGAEREIWWKLKDYKGEIPENQRQKLGHGSLFIMPTGFQNFFYHRIPKSDRACGVRISMTFRKYIKIR